MISLCCCFFILFLFLFRLFKEKEKAATTTTLNSKALAFTCCNVDFDEILNGALTSFNRISASIGRTTLLFCIQLQTVIDWRCFSLKRGDLMMKGHIKFYKCVLKKKTNINFNSIFKSQRYRLLITSSSL